MKKVIGLSIIVLILVSACHQKKQPETSVKDNRQVLLDSITHYEKILHAELELDLKKAEKMQSLYLNFCNQYKQDSLTPEYLFRAAEIAMNSNKPIDATSYLYRIDKQYKDFNKLSTVIYLLGYINQNMLGDLKTAEIYYNRFIEEYPEHSRVEEVRETLKTLHLSDIELIRQFEKNITKESL